MATAVNPKAIYLYTKKKKKRATTRANSAINAFRTVAVKTIQLYKSFFWGTFECVKVNAQISKIINK